MRLIHLSDLHIGKRVDVASMLEEQEYVLRQILQIIDTEKADAVHFWLLPFVKPTHVRRFFPDAGIESYTDAIRTAIQHMALDKNARNVLLTHQFVTGAATCESEEVSVGGTDNVDAEVFEDFA